MRRKKERSKQGQTNKQGKATQHTQGSHFPRNMYMLRFAHVHNVHVHVCACQYMFYCCRTDVFVKLLVDIVLYKVLVDSIVQ